MAQSLVQIYLHTVFSTKNRHPFLKNKETRERLHAYLAGICRNLDCPALIIGGIEDHVHLLTRHSKNISVADFLRELKRDSSKWIKTSGTDFKRFSWQNGYGSFSVSPSHVPAVEKYIEGQEGHHRRETYQDEYRRLCRKYGVEIDERYVWD